MEDTPLTHRLRVDVRWRDLDQLGHLNQSVYHEYLEEGRAALIAGLGRADFDFVLAHVALDYRHEVRKDHGHVEVLSEVTTVGRSSLTITNRILLPDGTVAAEGESVLVAWDREARRSKQLTPDQRAALQGGVAA